MYCNTIQDGWIWGNALQWGNESLMLYGLNVDIIQSINSEIDS